MSDIFDKINENAARAAKAAQRENARLAALRVKKANRAMACRALIAAVLIVTFWAGALSGWLHRGVALMGLASVWVWLAVWLGAWMQFRWAKRGLLR